MFNKNEATFKEAETIIGPSIKVKGNFHGEGNIIIEGIVEGTVKTNQSLLVGNKAKITANIKAKTATIGGEVSGDIEVKGYLEVLSSAKIFGNMTSSQISIEKGAIINGKCEMLSKQLDRKIDNK
jgi:cytoskeletal protein CcmA (bactofilin family)